MIDTATAMEGQIKYQAENLERLEEIKSKDCELARRNDQIEAQAGDLRRLKRQLLDTFDTAREIGVSKQCLKAKIEVLVRDAKESRAIVDKVGTALRVPREEIVGLLDEIRKEKSKAVGVHMRGQAKDAVLEEENEEEMDPSARLRAEFLS